MYTESYNINTLFAQLGLPYSNQDITAFFAEHQITDNVLLQDAPCWNDGQRAFLAESLAEDGAWTTVIDELDTRIRKGE